MSSIRTNIAASLIVSLLCACGTQKAAELEPQAPALLTSQPQTKITKNADGNYINPDGWQVPALPVNRKYESTLLKSGDRKVRVLSYYYSPKGKLLLESLYAVMNIPDFGDVMSITEQADSKKKAFCYRIAATRIMPPGTNGTGILVVAFLRDDDGDGVFETLASGCPIPGWVK